MQKNQVIVIGVIIALLAGITFFQSDLKSNLDYRVERLNNCYAKNACNASSWVGTILGSRKVCNQCNRSFFKIKNVPQKVIQEDEIIGEWFPVKTTKGGLGNGITFKEDGKMETAFGAYLDFQYTIDEDRLAMKFSDGSEIIYSFDVDAKNLTLTSDTGEKQELIRVLENSKNDIVGKWEGDHYTGGKQIIDFVGSWKGYLSVPANFQEAEYEVFENAIKFSGEQESHWKWYVEDDRLTIIMNDEGYSEEYVRIR